MPLYDADTKTHKGTHSGTRHIPAVVSLKQKQERVHTHTAAHSKGDVAGSLTCCDGPCGSGSEICGE